MLMFEPDVLDRLTSSRLPADGRNGPNDELIPPLTDL